MSDMRHMEYLQGVANADVRRLEEKEAVYRGSWKKRGGTGAFFVLARKWDALENLLSDPEYRYDIFYAAEQDGTGDGSVIDQIQDLRRYLLLVESELMARMVPLPQSRKTSEAAEYAMERADADPHTRIDAELDELWPLISNSVPIAYEGLYDFCSVNGVTLRKLKPVLDVERWRSAPHGVQNCYIAPKDTDQLVFFKVECIERVTNYITPRSTPAHNTVVELDSSIELTRPSDS
jgi:hypothetical protein